MFHIFYLIPAVTWSLACVSSPGRKENSCILMRHLLVLFVFISRASSLIMTEWIPGFYFICFYYFNLPNTQIGFSGTNKEPSEEENSFIKKSVWHDNGTDFLVKLCGSFKWVNKEDAFWGFLVFCKKCPGAWRQSWETFGGTLFGCLKNCLLHCSHSWEESRILVTGLATQSCLLIVHCIGKNPREHKDFSLME